MNVDVYLEREGAMVCIQAQQVEMVLKTHADRKDITTGRVRGLRLRSSFTFGIIVSVRVMYESSAIDSFSPCPVYLLYNY